MKESTLNGITRYVQDGVPPGGFLLAVFTNDLLGSFMHADEENSRDLKEIVHYIYNNVPAASWGSKEKVFSWVAQKAKEREERE